MEWRENVPGLESKVNPPLWPPKKALKMLFASKSVETGSRARLTWRIKGSQRWEKNGNTGRKTIYVIYCTYNLKRNRNYKCFFGFFLNYYLFIYFFSTGPIWTGLKCTASYWQTSIRTVQIFVDLKIRYQPIFFLFRHTMQKNSQHLLV